MTGFITIEDRREIHIQDMAELTGLTVEEIRKLYSGKEAGNVTTEDTDRITPVRDSES